MTADDAVCPGCNATLRGVTTEAGSYVRCLNCGKRFVPGENAPPVTVSESPAPVLRRKEPVSPGYWLLRIPSIFCIVCSLGLCIFLLFSLQTPPWRWDKIWLLVYLPLLPMLALLLYWITRSLHRIESNCLAVAWSLGQDIELPPAPGSSLPYILPLAVMGGTLPFIALRQVRVGGSMLSNADLIPYVIQGALAFYAGIAMEDIRQFIWRQSCIANCFLPQRSTVVLYYSAVWAGCAYLALAATYAATYWPGSNSGGTYFYYYSQNNDNLHGFAAIANAAFAVTAILIGINWDRAVATWRARTSAAFEDDKLPLFIRWLRLLTLLPSIGLLAYTIFERFIQNVTRYGPWNAKVMFMISITLCFFALLLSFAVAQLFRWRQAQCEIAGIPASSVGFGKGYRVVQATVLALSASAALACAVFWFQFGMWSLQTSLLFTFILVGFGLHLMPLWLLVIAREFLLVEALWTKQRARLTGENAP